MKVLSPLIVACALASFFAGFLFSLFADDSTPALLPGQGTTLQIASGFWMLYYWMAFVLMYACIHRPPPRRCPNGHEVAATDACCAWCGAQVES
jgi:hypothetical protein